MKLLIITQKVDQNDAILGFFHDWLEEFAKKVEELYVISSFVGEYHLSNNVKVFSLGKELDQAKFFRYLKFYQLVLELLPSCDKVLSHMCPEYIIALAPINIFYQKDLYLWYVHRQVSPRLKLAEKLVKKVFTASPESFQLPSPKKVILGHGINVDRFKANQATVKPDKTKYKIIYVGRISQIKNQDLLIKALNLLVNEKNIKSLQVEIIGSPLLAADQDYFKELKRLVNKFELANYLKFTGSVPNLNIINYYQAADLSINLSPTGGLDKAVLEAMACELPVIVANQSFKEFFGNFQKYLLLAEISPEKLAERIQQLLNLNKEMKAEMGFYLRSQVTNHHSLNNLIKKIIEEM